MEVRAELRERGHDEDASKSRSATRLGGSPADRDQRHVAPKTDGSQSSSAFRGFESSHAGGSNKVGVIDLRLSSLVNERLNCETSTATCSPHRGADESSPVPNGSGIGGGEMDRARNG